MDIRQKNENRIIVELSREELCALHLTFEEMDYKNPQTRDALQSLLKNAAKTLGLPISSAEKLLIEAIPDDSGGCILLFTAPMQKRRPFRGKALLKNSVCGFACTVEDLDALYLLLQRLQTADTKFTACKLYRAGKGYILAVKPEFLCFPQMRRLLSEYGSVAPLNRLSLACLSEHAELLSETPISALCS